jgi:hypothetical protein
MAQDALDSTLQPSCAEVSLKDIVTSTSYTVAPVKPAV